MIFLGCWKGNPAALLCQRAPPAQEQPAIAHDLPVKKEHPQRHCMRLAATARTAFAEPLA